MSTPVKLTTPVKVEIFDTKALDAEIKLRSPEIHKEIKIELEDVKKLEKEKKKSPKDDAMDRGEKDETKEKKIEDKKIKGKGKKKKETEEKEEESDAEKRTDKKVEPEKKKSKKKVKRKADEPTDKSDVVVEEAPEEGNKSKAEETKPDKTEKSKAELSEIISSGESDSSSKPQPSVSSPKQPTPCTSSHDTKEVPGPSVRSPRDVHSKPEENEAKPIPEASPSHIQLPAPQPNVHLPVAPHSAVFPDPMALLAHVSSTAQAAATNTVFPTTPPDTPERSPQVLSPGGLSPEQDSSSLRSEGGMDSEMMGEPSHAHHHHHHHHAHGGESPNTCDTSTLSNGSSAGSSGNLPSSESGTEAAPATSTAKRKSAAVDEEDEEESDLKPPKKKKRGHKRHATAGQSSEKSNKSSSKHHSSMCTYFLEFHAKFRRNFNFVGIQKRSDFERYTFCGSVTPLRLCSGKLVVSDAQNLPLKIFAVVLATRVAKRKRFRTSSPPAHLSEVLSMPCALWLSEAAPPPPLSNTNQGWPLHLCFTFGRLMSFKIPFLLDTQIMLVLSVSCPVRTVNSTCVGSNTATQPRCIVESTSVIQAGKRGFWTETSNF